MTAATHDTGWVPEDPPGAAADEQAATPTRKTRYGSLDAWVCGHFAPLIHRRLGGSLTWCPWWWKHSEAVSRLNALWHEWEQARVDGSMSAWWLQHADPHLTVLLSRDNGPFMACKPDPPKHTELDPLPLAESDPALWLGPAYSDPPHDTG